MRSQGEGEWIPKLKALADESRLALVGCLLDGPMTVAGLAEASGQTVYNASKHLRILREAGIVVTRREGRFQISRISEDFIAAVDKDSRSLDLGCCLFRFPARRGFAGSGRRR